LQTLSFDNGVKRGRKLVIWRYIMSRGGARPGAGRPKGKGKFGEVTKPVRIPLSRVEEVLEYIESPRYRFPVYETNISAGSPSPVEDFTEGEIDLNKYLVDNPDSTFFVRVTGDSMINAAIHEGDLLIVDRSLKPRHGKIVIASVDGMLTVKTLHKENDKTALMPANDTYQPIELAEGSEMIIWGVVTQVLHSV